ncbi:MAG: GNAT family N-acetyltransferase [Anaerolineales bacterium]|nr:GNAT family N-acetyltransferase [Anaerolineales bacterium]
MRLLKSLFYQLVDALQTFRIKGWRAGLTQLAKTGRRVIYNQDEFIVLAKALFPAEPPPDPLPGLTVRRLTTEADVNKLEPLAGATDMVRFQRMFALGAVVFAAFLEGQVIGWGWLADKIDPQTNRVQAPLNPGDACLYDLFVAPDFRDRGIAQRLVASRLQFLRDHGYQRSVITCSKDNLAALKVAQRVGYVSVGKSHHTRLLFWDRYEYETFELEEPYRV